MEYFRVVTSFCCWPEISELCYLIFLSMQNLAAQDGLSAVIERVPGLRVITVSGEDGIILLKYPEDTVSDSFGALDSAFRTALDQVIVF